MLRIAETAPRLKYLLHLHIVLPILRQGIFNDNLSLQGSFHNVSMHGYFSCLSPVNNSQQIHSVAVVVFHLII